MHRPLRSQQRLVAGIVAAIASGQTTPADILAAMTPDEAPMFRSRERGTKGRLCPSGEHRVVKAAARRAGYDEDGRGALAAAGQCLLARAERGASGRPLLQVRW